MFPRCALNLPFSILHPRRFLWRRRFAHGISRSRAGLRYDGASGHRHSDVLKNYFKFRRLFTNCSRWRSSASRTPSSAWITAGSICVLATPSNNTSVKIVGVRAVEPEDYSVRVAAGLGVASGPANLLAADYDLLLSIFPFEKDWYAKRVPKLRVEFVGHPMVERFNSEGRVPRAPDTEKLGTRRARPSEILLCLAAARVSCNGTCRPCSAR